MSNDVLIYLDLHPFYVYIPSVCNPKTIIYLNKYCTPLDIGYSD